MARWLAVAVFAVLTVASYRAMKPSLDTMSAPGGRGMLALQDARTPAEVGAIRARWGPEGDAAARRSLWVDLPFILGYGGLLAFVAGWCAVAADGRGWTGWARFGAVLAVLFVVAALADVAEDVGLFAELRTAPVSRAVPLFASACSWVKWRIVYVGAPLLVTDVVAMVARR